MNHELQHIWQAIAEELERTVPATTYEIWLSPLLPVALDGRTLTVAAPEELRAWVAERFSARLAAAATQVLRTPATVLVVASAAPGPPAPASQQPLRRVSDPSHESTPPRVADPELNPKFTFGQFVIGDANRFAHAAALAVAELPAQAYNPLFIYGPPGVGKTHLLHAIGNYVQRYGAGLTVRFTTVEHFTNDFIASLHQGTGAVDRFKGRYRGVDVLLIDDVQFLESKAKTEEEFFHTFNALSDTGSQLVLTSDRVPADLAGLEDRLRERFEAGLVTAITAPDHATRTAVLRKRVQHDGLAIAEPGVLDLIADHIPTNIRTLEGALIRVVAFASLTGRAVTLALAGEVLAGLYGEDARNAKSLGVIPTITVDQVVATTCDAFGLTPEELLSDNRATRVTWPRQLAMYLAREHTSETLPALGRQFGGRNHTTVMHAIKRASARVAGDPEAYALLHTLTQRLHEPRSDRRD